MKSNMYKWHRIPRRQPMDGYQKLCVWLIVLLAAQLVVLTVFGCGAQAQESMHYSVGEYPETAYRWANVNAWEVNFREGPGMDAPVVAQYSLGTCVEVVSVWDGWAEVLHHNHLHRGALYVWAEYLDFVE